MQKKSYRLRKPGNVKKMPGFKIKENTISKPPQGLLLLAVAFILHYFNNSSANLIQIESRKLTLTVPDFNFSPVSGLSIRSRGMGF